MSGQLMGLVLSGGLSTRMGRDKGSLLIHKTLDLRSRAYELLASVCSQVFISCRKTQDSLIPAILPRIYDNLRETLGAGPGVGLLSAFEKFPSEAWLVFACDMLYVDKATIDLLVRHRNPTQAATVFIQPQTKKIEPLFGIWEPSALAALKNNFKQGNFSPRHALENLPCEILTLPDSQLLCSANTPSEFQKACTHFFPTCSKTFART